MVRKNTLKRYSLCVALALPFLSSLLAYANIGLFTRYWFDDFCTAAILQRQGFVGSQAHWYTNWSGRYSFHLAVNMVELVGPWAVRALPFIILAIWLALATWAADRLLTAVNLPAPAGMPFVVAALVIFATLESSPDIVQSLYWQTGSLTYLVPIVLLTACVAVIAGGAAEGKKSTPTRIILCALLTFIAGGFSEVYAVLQTACFVLLIFAWSVRPSGRPTLRPLLIVGLAGSLVALAIIAAAPGNEVRHAKMPPPADLLDVIKSSFQYALNFIERQTRRSRGTFILTFALPAVLILAHRRTDTETADAVGLSLKSWLMLSLIAAVLSLILITCCFVPGFYAQSEALPLRAHIIPNFILVCLLMFLGVLASLGLLSLHLGRKIATLVIASGALLVASLIVLSPLAAARRTFALRGQARTYAATWDKTDGEIRAAVSKGATDVTVPVSETGSSQLGFSRPELQLTGDPQQPQNRCVALYYGLDSIKTQEFPK